MNIASYAYPNAESITRQRLDNGLTVLVYGTPNTESVVVQGSLRTGSIYEPFSQAGTASMTAAALMRGTQQHDGDALSAALENIGAELRPGSGNHRTGFNGRALAEDLPTLLSVLAESLRDPVFPDDEVNQLRTQRITELKYARQSTRYQAQRRFQETLYPGTHPYHHSSYGTLDTLPRISAPDLRDFHARTYGPAGMILVIVGAVKPLDVIDRVRELFGDWQNPAQPQPPVLPEAPPPRETVRVKKALPGKTQTDIVMGTIGPARSAPDYRAASLANSILGEFAMMGRIGNVIREQLGLAYYAYTRLQTIDGPGAWQVTMGVAPQNVNLAVDRAREELRRLTTEPVPADDLADNQSYFTGRLPLRLESNSGLASAIHTMQRYGLGLDYLAHYHDAIYAITQQDVLQAARAYINPDALVVSLSGPADSDSE
jgi:zinc protease